MYPEIQKIKARLKLLESKPHPKVLDGTYNIYTLKGESALGQPYWYDISFISPRRIKVEEIVDTDVYVLLQDEKNEKENKKIYGKIFKVLEEGIIANKYMYNVKLVSPFYYLGETKRYEIYQEMNVIDIISKIISNYASLLNISIKANIPPSQKREYTTQYHQSDLEFIQMLCQEEGITLNIQGESDSFVMSLDNINDSYTPFEESHLECHFNLSKAFTVTHTEQDYYDFKVPSQEYKKTAGEKPLTQTLKDNSKTSQLREALKDYKLKDRLEENRSSDIERYVEKKSKSNYAQAETIYGRSQSILTSEGYGGRLYEEKTFFEIDAIITKVVYDCFFPNAIEEYKEDVPDTSKWQFSVDFEAVPIKTYFVPQYNIAKPIIYSSVTAIVSGGSYPPTPDFNTIDVDDKGRIRVVFHFDSQYPTSCYIRFANFWSGNGWGSQFIPRVNTEVIVNFLNGDPDRPVVIGSLYNGENKIPEDLPANKTKSYIKTQSIPGTPSEFNLLSFEDKGGSELVHMKAQKNHLLHVLNDSDNNIDHDERTVVGNDRTESVGHDEKITIGNNRTEKVGVNEDITIGLNRSEKVGANESITIGANRVKTVVLNESINIGINQSKIVGVNEKITIGVNRTASVGANEEIKIGANEKIEIGVNQSLTVGSNRNAKIGKEYLLNAGDKIVLQTGKSSLTMEKDGTIVLKGKDITFIATGEINVKAKKNITMKGKKILEN